MIPGLKGQRLILAATNASISVSGVAGPHGQYEFRWIVIDHAGEPAQIEQRRMALRADFRLAAAGSNFEMTAAAAAAAIASHSSGVVVGASVRIRNAADQESVTSP